MEFHKDFAGRYLAPLQMTDDILKVRLLLDASSLEVFAQNGETVSTDIFFPTSNERSFTLTTDSGKTPTVDHIKISQMTSAWFTETTKAASR